MEATLKLHLFWGNLKSGYVIWFKICFYYAGWKSVYILLAITKFSGLNFHLWKAQDLRPKHSSNHILRSEHYDRLSYIWAWAINTFYRLTRMCSLRWLVWMKICFLFNIRQYSPLGSCSSEWARPSLCVFAICWDDRCVRLEAALHRTITVWHQSTARAIRVDGSLCFRIALAALWCHTVIVLCRAASSRTHLKAIADGW